MAALLVLETFLVLVLALLTVRALADARWLEETRGNGAGLEELRRQNNQLAVDIDVCRDGELRALDKLIATLQKELDEQRAENRAAREAWEELANNFLARSLTPQVIDLHARPSPNPAKSRDASEREEELKTGEFYTCGHCGRATSNPLRVRPDGLPRVIYGCSPACAKRLING